MALNNQTIYIPKFSYPFEENSYEKYMQEISSLAKGNYLFTENGFWHGGIHFEGAMLSRLKSHKGIKCIADGEIVAYRINDEYINDTRGLYSSGFFLVRHFLEYPVNNRLTFFSLYMHTAKKEDYFIKVIGEKRFLRKGYEKSLISPIIGNELEIDTNIIVDGKWKKNRAKVLYVKNQEIDLSQDLTIHNSNVNKEEEIRYFKNIGEILKREKINEIDILEIPIEIKAGEIIGLIGEYNVNNEENEKCMHLEVIADDNLKRYVENITEEENVPQNLKWARIIDVESKDKISIFENLEVMYDNNIKEDIQINEMYKELFDLADKDNNGKLEPYEIKQAVINKDIKEVTSKYIVKHSSEWDEKINMVDEIEKIVKKIDKNRFENKEEYIKILEIERKRIKNLSLFEKCKEIEGFPKSDEVFHINAIGLVKAFKKCKITKEMLIAMGCIQASKDQTLIDALNKYCEQYEINTCLRVAHFLAQAAHESGGFTTQTESGKYKESIAIQSSCYSAYRNTTSGRNVQLTPRRNRQGEIIDYDCKQPEYFNCKYGGKNGNTQIDLSDPNKKYYYQINDGFNYRGRGIMQITGRGTYEAYQNDHAQRNPNDIKDFLGNPDFVTSSKEYEVASGCSYWFNKTDRHNKKLNAYADEGSSDEIVLKVSAVINGFYDKDASDYNSFSDTEKAKYLKAEDDLYLKIPNGYNEPNKSFSRLPLFHKLKNHMGL